MGGGQDEEAYCAATPYFHEDGGIPQGQDHAEAGRSFALVQGITTLELRDGACGVKRLSRSKYKVKGLNRN